MIIRKILYIPLIVSLFHCTEPMGEIGAQNESSQVEGSSEGDDALCSEGSLGGMSHSSSFMSSSSERTSSSSSSSSSLGESSQMSSNHDTVSSSEVMVSSSSGGGESSVMSSSMSVSSSVVAVSSSTVSSSSIASSSSEAETVGPLRVLLFHKTEGWEHGSIGTGVSMVHTLASTYDFVVHDTKDASVFNDTFLDTIDVVYFLNTTKDVLNGNQEDALKRFIESDKGFVGNHAATDTEYDWDYYTELVGTRFKSHPDNMQETNLIPLGEAHPATDHIADTIWIREECYNFQGVPNSDFTLLLEYDESKYDAGNDAMGFHPMTWYRELNPGRSFYTALGHADAMYGNDFFKRMMLNALFWAGGRDVPVWEG
ncbi:MAG: ThuA domain-containing protein [Fibrobacterales bacterium]